MQVDINQELSIDYLTEIDKVSEKLQRYGVCIVNNVLNETECSNLVNGMLSTLSYVTSAMPTPFNVFNVDSWSTLDSLQPTRNLIYQNWGLGQSQFVWDVRCNPKCIDVFARMYGTDDLLVSFDGFSFALPPEIKKTGNNWEKDHWYHFDQSTTRPNFECVQGWINGFDTNPGDATLSVMIGSHALHYQYGQTHTVDGKADWVKIDDKAFFLSQGCIEHRIVATKGSLVLWDSRVLHYGAKPLNGRPTLNYRAVVYLCYTPRRLISEKDLKRKIEIFHKRGTKGFKRVTNHWPHRPVMFSELPRIWDGIVPNILPLPDPIIPDNFFHIIGYPKKKL